MLTTGNSKLCAEIASAFGLKNCRRCTVYMEVNKAVTIEAEVYPDEQELRDVVLILKKYQIIAVDDGTQTAMIANTGGISFILDKVALLYRQFISCVKINFRRYIGYGDGTRKKCGSAGS